MEISAHAYHRLVRPAWVTKRYIHDVIQRHYRFDNKTVLDFGSGVGSNCRLVDPAHYVGFDACPDRVRFARRLHADYRFHSLAGHRLPVPSAWCDYVLIVAVLHHVASDLLGKYVEEFGRVLKPTGAVIVIEPCLSPQSCMTNWWMRHLDRGQHLRDEHGYRELFHGQGFDTQVLCRFRKLLLYREILFAATRP